MECKFYDFGCLLNWSFEEGKTLALTAFDKVLSGFAVVYESIPVPDFLLNIGTLSSGLSSQTLYFINLFNLPAGIAIVASAYAARFLLRRIPVIG